LEPEGTVGDAVRGKRYAAVDSCQAEYKASLIQARGHISGKPYTFYIYTGSTHSFISPIVVAVCKLSTEKLQNPWKVQMENGAKKWINQAVDRCVVDRGGWTSTICFHELALGSYDGIIGQDWLELHKTNVDCYEKKVQNFLFKWALNIKSISFKALAHRCRR